MGTVRTRPINHQASCDKIEYLEIFDSYRMFASFCYYEWLVTCSVILELRFAQ
jgi:hypothetical protein